MRAEVELLAGLSHPGIVRVEGSYESPTSVLIVFEKLYGELLDQSYESWSEQEIAEVTLQLLHALDYLHHQRIVHRDIKLENIMLDKGGKVKFVDFGFATRLQPGKKLTDKVGSLQYVAPEVLSGKPYDESCDLFSMGSVVYTLLTGGDPLFDDECGDVRQKNRSGEVDWSEDFYRLPQDAQNFLRWLLAVDPENRPCVTQALQHPWLSTAAAKARLLS